MLLTDLIEGLSILPSDVVCTYAATKVLRMRNVAAFWVVRMGLSVALALLRYVIPFEFRLIFGLFLYLAVPLLMSKGRLGYRLLAVVLMFVVLSVAEVIGMALWYALTGMLLVNESDLNVGMPEFWMVRLLHLLTISLMMGALAATLPRLVGEARDRGTVVVTGLLVVQVTLLSLCIYAMQYLENDKLFLCVTSVVLGAACLLVDAYLLYVINRYEGRLLGEERVRMLEGQLGEYLGRYESVAENIGRVARLRHDVRNQLQVVGDLAERGERDRAKEMLDAMIGYCADAGEALRGLDGTSAQAGEGRARASEGRMQASEGRADVGAAAAAYAQGACGGDAGSQEASL